MEHAYRDGQPSALAAFEATGRAYLAFARVHPGHYIAMFESGISVSRTLELSHASQRALGFIDRAAQELCHNMPEDRRPPRIHVQRPYLGNGTRCCRIVCAQIRRCARPV